MNELERSIRKRILMLRILFILGLVFLTLFVGTFFGRYQHHILMVIFGDSFSICLILFLWYLGDN